MPEDEQTPSHITCLACKLVVKTGVTGRMHRAITYLRGLGTSPFHSTTEQDKLLPACFGKADKCVAHLKLRK